MKFIKGLLLIILAISVCAFSVACTEEEAPSPDEKGDFGYKASDDGTATITNCTATYTKLVIPAEIDGYKVTAIADGAFFNYSAATELVISDGITSIGKSAFEHCMSLKSVTVPKSVESLGEKAFNDCVKLEEIAIDGGSALKFIGINAFSGCRALNTEEYGGAVYLPIGESSHALLISAVSQSITEAEIHPDTEIIAGNAFSQCAAITKITIPEKVRHIGDKAFYGCTNLDKIYFNAIMMDDLAQGSALFERVATKSETMTLFIGSKVKRIPAYLMDSTSRLRIVKFADDTVCESIGAYAFAGTPLPDFTIPKSLKRIEPFAFANCQWLADIKLDADDLGDLTADSDIFSGTGSKTAGVTLTIGREAKRVPAYFCDGFRSLAQVKFENSDVTSSFGANAFIDCDGIQRVLVTSRKGWCESTFENEYSNPIRYGNAVFYIEDTSVTEGLILTKDITFISDYAFIGYKGLSKIVIPLTVQSIGKSAFSGVNNLYTIYWGGTEAEWNQLLIKEDNDILSKSTVYFYTENPPTSPGNYWCYGEEDIPKIWRNTAVGE